MRKFRNFKIRWNPDAPAHDIGYARVSTDEQSLDLQIDALRKAGVREDDLHVETVSGASSKRPELDWALSTLRPGDTFVVWKMDRIARSLTELLRRMRQVDEAGAGFKSLTESIDTTTPAGRLIMHVMGAIAEFERDLIVERTKAGMAAAKARGAQIGQPRKLDNKQVVEAQKMRDDGVSPKKIADHFGVSRGTIYNYTVGPTRTRSKAGDDSK